MSWKTYPYSRVWEDDGLGNVPVVNVELFNKNKSINQLALIDSGANVSLINSEIALFLGIDLSHCQKKSISGIVGGSMEGYLCNILLKVDQFDEKIEIPVLFVENLNFTMLLGQNGFFDHFKVGFNRKDQRFSLMSIDEEIQNMIDGGFQGFAGLSNESDKS